MQFALGAVHTCPDIFEFETFSFRIKKIQIEFARPHVFDTYPDSL